MNELIQNLKSKPELILEEGDSSWVFRVPFTPEYYFELTIPKDVNEWIFVEPGELPENFEIP